MKPDIIIHHLSDFHIGNAQYSPENKLSFFNMKEIKSYNINYYIEYLSSCSDEAIPDILIVTGDLTTYATEDEMDIAGEKLVIIKELMKKKKTSKRKKKDPYIFIVPGNHDLDWSQSEYSQKINRYAKMSTVLFNKDNDIISCCYKNNNAPIYFAFDEPWNMLIYLFNSTKLGGSINPDIKDIYNETISLTKNNMSEDEAKQFQDLNTKLFKYMREDPGFIEKSDLDRMETKIKKVNSEIKIAVMHHNPAPVITNDLERYDSIINSGIVNSYLIRNNFDIVLHGHKHSKQVSRLIYPANNNKGIVIISGDTIGCKEHCPFYELQIYIKKNENNNPSFFSLFEVEKHEMHFNLNKNSIVTEFFDNKIVSDIKNMQLALAECPDIKNSDTLENINEFLVSIHDLKNRIIDWSEESSNWITTFHYSLEHYNSIYAIDVYSRNSISSNYFYIYLHDQYNARLEKIKFNKKLVYSPLVYKTIKRTGWEPNKSIWRGFEIVDGDIDDSSLQIVRILIRKKISSKEEKYSLQNLDYMHKLVAIPLFVIDVDILKAENKTDFIKDVALGIRNDNHCIRCFEYVNERCEVIEVDPKSAGSDLIEMFEELLQHQELKTVDDFIGNTGIMIKDRNKLKMFAERYDKTRRASNSILDVLTKRMMPNHKQVGLDIGCGTGNYTIPFRDEFKDVYGIDISEEMLAVAKRKDIVNRIHWINEDFLDCSFDNIFFDKIWGISTLHYFRNDKLVKFFTKVHSILRPEGIAIFDTEFEGQHMSLWLQEYFPSLKERYKDVTLSTEQYNSLLTKELNFASFEPIFLEYPSNSQDGCLRIGQYNPERYLDHKIRDNIPAFCEMDTNELEIGLGRLKNDIQSKHIASVINLYKSKATNEGDIGFILVRK